MGGHLSKLSHNPVSLQHSVHMGLGIPNPPEYVIPDGFRLCTVCWPPDLLARVRVRRAAFQMPPGDSRQLRQRYGAASASSTTA
jgi:hypothetical protein